MIPTRLKMEATTSSPLERIRKGLAAPASLQQPIKTKIEKQKKEKAPKAPKKPKGPISVPLMPVPCPSDLTEAARWHGTRLAIILSRIPADEPPRPHNESSKKNLISPQLLESAAGLAKACGFGESATGGPFRRGKRCFWECVAICSWFHKREKDVLSRGAALELVAETLKEKLQ